MSDLKITLIQSDLFWENKEQNLKMFAEKIHAIDKSPDLIVLPEMFTTGFSMRPEIFGESITDNTTSWMKEQARKKNCSITGSFICEENKQYFNRLVWASPDGHITFYDKRHLFSMGEENKHYTAGNSSLIIDLNGWKIKPLICYDLRFPVWSRNSNETNNSYDVLIYVANWPERRSQAWKSLLPARAIENQCYVVGLNRVGNDENNISHSGDSAVIDFMGSVISKIQPHEEATETITLKKQELNNFRRDFPVLLDADKFEIKD
jgi:omega-amidase